MVVVKKIVRTAVWIGLWSCLLTVSVQAGSYYSEDRVLKGFGRAIDGDSLDLAGKEIRLQGMDAMEYHQRCSYQEESWACGKEAYKFLQSIVKKGEMTCYIQETDKYKRNVAVCFVNGKDIALQLVEEGYAIALPWFNEYYVPAASMARQQRKGVWKGSFQEPSAWRKKKYK